MGLIGGGAVPARSALRSHHGDAGIPDGLSANHHKAWSTLTEIAMGSVMDKKDKSMADGSGLAHPSNAPVKRFAPRSIEHIMAQLLKVGSTKPVPDPAQKWLQRPDATSLSGAKHDASADEIHLEYFSVLSDDDAVREGFEQFLLKYFKLSDPFKFTKDDFEFRSIINACVEFQAHSLANGIAFDFRLIREPWSFARKKTVIEAYKISDYLPLWRYNVRIDRHFDEYYSLMPSEYRDEILSDVRSDDPLTGAVGRALTTVGLGQEYVRALTTALVAELAKQQLAISPATEVASPAQVELPAEAPETYQGLRGPETPPEFVKRVYGPWLGQGLTRADIRKLDPKLSVAITNWLSRPGNEWPADVDLPTKAEQNERLLSAGPEAIREHLGKFTGQEALREAARINAAAHYRK